MKPVTNLQNVKGGTPMSLVTAVAKGIVNSYLNDTYKVPETEAEWALYEELLEECLAWLYMTGERTAYV